MSLYKMKRGQMEMVGLAVIVIILILAFILFLTLNRGQDTSVRTAGDSLYANNLLNAIMLYSLDEGSVEDYIGECYDATELDDMDKITKYCDETEVEIIKIIDAIKKKNQKYEISFDGDCGSIDNINQNVCGDEFITASPYYIRTKGGSCKIQLRFC